MEGFLLYLVCYDVGFILYGAPAVIWLFARGAVRRADVGSELSAASGRRSEVSEWPRSKFPASAVRQRRNFGYRNRIIGPYEKVCRGGRLCPPDAVGS